MERGILWFAIFCPAQVSIPGFGVRIYEATSHCWKMWLSVQIHWPGFWPQLSWEKTNRIRSGKTYSSRVMKLPLQCGRYFGAMRSRLKKNESWLLTYLADLATRYYISRIL